MNRISTVYRVTFFECVSAESRAN